MRLSASGLSVAETRGRESVDGHVDEPLDARVLDDVGLTRLGLKDNVERERLLLVTLRFIDLKV